MRPLLRRVSVVGTTGSGKTTLARRLAFRLNVPFIELDALSWESDWTARSSDEFRRLVAEAVAAETWVADGNYGQQAQELVWSRADAVVWLDYSFARVMWQLLFRTIRRTLTHEVLWAGNQESLQRAFLSRDSILLWGLRTYHRRRRQYPERFRDPRWKDIQVVHLTSPAQTDRWLNGLPTAALRDGGD